MMPRGKSPLGFVMTEKRKLAWERNFAIMRLRCMEGMIRVLPFSTEDRITMAAAIERTLKSLNAETQKEQWARFQKLREQQIKELELNS